LIKKSEPKSKNDSELKLNLLDLERQIEMLQNEMKLLSFKRMNYEENAAILRKKFDELRARRSNLIHKLNTEQIKWETRDDVNAQDLKTELLGKLPTILIKRDYFKTNEDLVNFAKKKLTVKLTTWQKKSRAEIIGLIIETVFSLKSDKIKEFYEAATAIKKREDEGKIGNIFLEWEKVIKNLKLRH